jgi:hypothetical protein
MAVAARAIEDVPDGGRRASHEIRAGNRRIRARWANGLSRHERPQEYEDGQSKHARHRRE